MVKLLESLFSNWLMAFGMSSVDRGMWLLWILWGFILLAVLMLVINVVAQKLFKVTLFK